jgi:hypothetical protein
VQRVGGIALAPWYAVLMVYAQMEPGVCVKESYKIIIVIKDKISKFDEDK